MTLTAHTICLPCWDFDILFSIPTAKRRRGREAASKLTVAQTFFERSRFCSMCHYASLDVVGT